MAQTSDILERLRVTSQHLELTFKLSPQVASLTNNSFTLYWVEDQDNAPDPPGNVEFSELVEPDYVPVSPDFQTIKTHKHYNSISRRLTLFLEEPESLTGGWYALGIEGVRGANGSSFASEAVIFSYEQPIEAPPPKGTTPTEFTIIDHSIKRDAFSLPVSSSPESTTLVDSKPKQDTIFISSTFNQGKIQLDMNKVILDSPENLENIRAQKKDLSAGRMARWQDVEVDIDLSSNGKRILIDFPLEEDEYFPINHKYRIIVSKNLKVGNA